MRMLALYALARRSSTNDEEGAFVSIISGHVFGENHVFVKNDPHPHSPPARGFKNRGGVIQIQYYEHLQFYLLLLQISYIISEIQ